MHELELIPRLHDLFGSPPEPVLGIGDDAAVFSPTAGTDMVWTTDTFVEDVHFRWPWLSPKEIGSRAATASLSDCAAMGAKPRYALVTFHIPSTFDAKTVLAIASGLQARCAEYETIILGGNVTQNKIFSIETSILGEVPRGMALRRSSAKPGEDVYITRPTGGAALAVELLTRTSRTQEAEAVIQGWRTSIPRIEEGQVLREFASACIDISDGLVGDAHHVAETSRVDIILSEASLPSSETYRSLCQSFNLSWDVLRFGPGDDYELLFTSAPVLRESIRRKLKKKAFLIGSVTKGVGRVHLQRLDGSKILLERTGWNHGTLNARK